MFGRSTKLSQLEARNRELEAALKIEPGAPIPAAAVEVNTDGAQASVVTPATQAAVPAAKSEEKKKDSDTDDEPVNEDDDAEDAEDEDLEEEEKKKAAGMAPLEAAKFRAGCLRSKLHALKANFEQRVDTEITKRDGVRAAAYEDRLGKRAAQIFANATGAPLKANPNNKADGGAQQADTAALKGRAAVVAAIAAERQSGAAVMPG